MLISGWCSAAKSTLQCSYSFCRGGTPGLFPTFNSYKLCCSQCSCTGLGGIPTGVLPEVKERNGVHTPCARAVCPPGACPEPSLNIQSDNHACLWEEGLRSKESFTDMSLLIFCTILNCFKGYGLCLQYNISSSKGEIEWIQSLFWTVVTVTLNFLSFSGGCQCYQSLFAGFSQEKSARKRSLMSPDRTCALI